MTQINVKERVEVLTSEMTVEQQAAIRALGDDLDLLNQAMVACVESGLSIELQRTARHHADDGYWGDLLVPKVVKQRRPVNVLQHLERARDLRSAYASKLLLRMWRSLTRIAVGDRHRAGI